MHYIPNYEYIHKRAGPAIKKGVDSAHHAKWDIGDVWQRLGQAAVWLQGDARYCNSTSPEFAPKRHATRACACDYWGMRPY